MNEDLTSPANVPGRKDCRSGNQETSDDEVIFLTIGLFRHFDLAE